jgi:hypothetical protein
VVSPTDAGSLLQDEPSNRADKHDAEPKQAAGALVDVNIKGKDVFGIGGAAKTPAAKSIADAFARLMDAISDPLHTYLKGHAETSIEARRIERIAAAEAKAAVVYEQANLVGRNGDDEVRQRAGRRLLATEIRKQINLENAAKEAIETVESLEGGASAASDIPADWMEKWAEGAQNASAEQVRSIYAKILADKASNKSGGVGAPSLNLLAELDSNLADKFRKYAEFLSIFGCYPLQDNIDPAIISSKELNLLVEIGFMKIASTDSFKFRECSVSFGDYSHKFSRFLHQGLFFTYRSIDIANALFGNRTNLSNF